MTIDQLSGGRMLLGVGLVGAAGRGGLARRQPMASRCQTREYIGHRAQNSGAKEPFDVRGRILRYSLRGGGRFGPRQATQDHPARAADLPIYLAAIGPKNVELAAEIADGWLPIFFSPQRMDLFREYLEQGRARAKASRTPFRTSRSPRVHKIELGPDVNACRNAVKSTLALYISGMGPGDKTSITTWLLATATRRRRRTFKVLSFTGGKPKLHPRYRTNW